jgi:hypothetical protein
MGTRLALSLVFAVLSGAAVAQDSGSIEVLDLLSPSGRKIVQPDWEAIKGRPLGSKENPVRAFQPPGERDYLSRLVCRDGSRPSFRRTGSIGPGPYTTILNAYEVKCREVAHQVIIDMYHPGYVECRAVPGFSLRGPCPGA